MTNACGAQCLSDFGIDEGKYIEEARIPEKGQVC
jgi:hypothetical protein